MLVILLIPLISTTAAKTRGGTPIYKVHRYVPL